MADSGLYELSLALSRFLDRVGGGEPLSLSVSLSDANEVSELRARVAALQDALDAKDAAFRRAEFTARCNSIVCLRVVDWCRENGIIIPRSLYKGLDEF